MDQLRKIENDTLEVHFASFSLCLHWWTCFLLCLAYSYDLQINSVTCLHVALPFKTIGVTCVLIMFCTFGMIFFLYFFIFVLRLQWAKKLGWLFLAIGGRTSWLQCWGTFDGIEYHNGYFIGKFNHRIGKYRHHNGDYIGKFNHHIRKSRQHNGEIQATTLGDLDTTTGWWKIQTPQ